MPLSSKERWLVIDGLRGVYVPQFFASIYGPVSLASRGVRPLPSIGQKDGRDNPWHLSKEDEAGLLKGPDYENYWEVWDDVLSKAFLDGDDGSKWHLDYDGGDLFAVREKK